MRERCGYGTPRGLQGALSALGKRLTLVTDALDRVLGRMVRRSAVVIAQLRILLLEPTADPRLVATGHLQQAVREKNREFLPGARPTMGAGSKQAGAWLASRYSDMVVYLLVLESNSVARRFYERLRARNAETLTMETHGGAVVRNCRYTWPRPQRMSVA
jgi:hypothetical protein